MGPIISGLFAGNAVIIKNSENTAWSSAYFIAIVQNALKACGHDPHLVDAVTCWPQTADHLTSHPGISHLTFIGSRPVAHEVARSASKVLTPLCVELGGKDAAIVLDKPNGRAMSQSELKTIASMIMRGSFQSGGQNCVGIERVIAMPGAYESLVRLLEPRVNALRIGDDLDPDSDTNPVDVGAMQCSGAAFDRLEKLIAEAQSQGARLLAGGKRYRNPKYPAGHYFTPTLLVDATPDMRIAQEELFAPVCLLMRATDATHATSITNSTEYGLGCSVFGPTDSRAARAQLAQVTRGVNTGMVAVNDIASYYVVQLPFGGVRGSGYGRFAGDEGLRGLCNAKSVCMDRFPSIIKTAIPAALDYPMGIGAWLAARGIVEVGFGESWARRGTGVRRLMGF
jgi:acyl-CoA reductase-like NAD-dependent aldehyde dehydrogenase